MSIQRLAAVLAFVLSALVVAGCGNDSVTTGGTPTEKQVQKEKMKAGPEGGPGKK